MLIKTMKENERARTVCVRSFARGNHPFTGVFIHIIVKHMLYVSEYLKIKPMNERPRPCVRAVWDAGLA